MLSLSEIGIPSTWSSTVNPLASAANQATKHLALQLGVLPSNDIDRFDKSNFDLLSGYAYPSATFERLKLCNDWHWWLFFFDDKADEDSEFGCHSAKVRDLIEVCLNTLSNGTLRANPSALELFTANIRERMIALANEEWHKRFTADVEAYLYRGTLYAAENWHHGVVPDINTYCERRRYDSAVYTAEDLLEITEAGLMLPGEVFRDPEITALRDLCAQIVAFINDLFSYEKEVVFHNNPNNLVQVLMVNLKVSFLDAIARAITMINDDIAAFSELEKRLDNRANTHKNIPSFISGMKSWMYANVAWSLQSGRYASPTSPFAELRKHSGDGQNTPVSCWPMQRWSA